MVSPLCTYFNSCGGCTSQHIPYEVQVENKRRQLQHLLHVQDVSGIQVFHDKEYFYRNRMDFIFHPSGLGFRRRDKWYSIVDIDRCVISSEKLNQLLSEIRIFFKGVDKGVDSFDTKKHTGTFRYAVIRTPTEDSSISFILNLEGNVDEAKEKIKAFAKQTTANNIIIGHVDKETDSSVSENYIVVKGSEFLKETYLGKTFWYHSQGFFQNNSVMAEKMQSYVHETLKKYHTKDAHLLDLYAGVGTFGIINAGMFKTTTIVESVQQCITAAEKNIKENSVTNAKAIMLDAKQLKKLSLQKPLYIITDPPRTGMDIKTIQQINVLEPEVIVYISCNIQQLARDVPKFKNYCIKTVALFDLFPQTNHTEAVVELVKNGFQKN